MQVAQKQPTAIIIGENLVSRQGGRGKEWHYLLHFEGHAESEAEWYSGRHIRFRFLRWFCTFEVALARSHA